MSPKSDGFSLPAVVAVLLTIIVCAVPAAAFPEAPDPLTEIIVRFHEPPTADLLEMLRQQYPQIDSWRVHDSPLTVPHSGHPQPHPLACIAIAHIGPTVRDRDMNLLVAHLNQNTSVRYAERNGYTRACYEPNDVRYADQYAPQIMNMELAWEVEKGLRTTVLAVADTGIIFEHEDFSDNAIWTNTDDPINGVDDDGNGYVDDRRGWDFYYGDNAPVDYNGHGTHVAGIAGARLGNATGIAGMANITLMPIQILGNNGWGTWDAMTAGVYYAIDNGADVILIAGGGTDSTLSLEEAVAYATARRVPIIAAVGNENSPVEFYPAAYEDVIAVAGTDRDDLRYESSNFGNWIDVAAPAVDVLSTGIQSPSSYGVMTGTSMAAAHAAGLVALMQTADGSLTPAVIRQYLQTTADDLGQKNFDVLYGAGRINGFWALSEVINNMFTPLLPVTYSLKKGRIISGDLDSLCYNDAFPMVLDAGPVADGILGAERGKPIRFRVRSTSPVMNPDAYYFVVEASSNSSNIDQRISLYNFEIGDFQLLNVSTLTRKETQYRAEVSRNGYRFVDPDSGWVIAQIEYSLSGAPDTQPWEVSVDRTVWSLK